MFSQITEPTENMDKNRDNRTVEISVGSVKTDLNGKKRQKNKKPAVFNFQRPQFNKAISSKMLKHDLKDVAFLNKSNPHFFLKAVHNIFSLMHLLSEESFAKLHVWQFSIILGFSFERPRTKTIKNFSYHQPPIQNFTVTINL